MISLNFIRPAFISLLCLASTPAQAITWFVDAEVGADSDSNVSRSQYDSDRREDEFKHANLSLTLEDTLTRQSGFSSRLEFSAASFDGYTALNQQNLDLSLEYVVQPSYGFTANNYVLGLAFGVSEFDSEIRDNQHASLTLQLNKRLTDRLTLRSGLKHTVEDSDSKVFDIGKSDLFLNLDLNTNWGMALQGSLIYQQGDIVSSSRPTHLKFIQAADALIWDDAFGGRAANVIAYRLEADSLIFRGSLNFALTQSTTIDLSVTTVQTESPQYPIEYQRTISSFSLLHRF